MDQGESPIDLLISIDSRLPKQSCVIEREIKPQLKNLQSIHTAFM